MISKKVVVLGAVFLLTFNYSLATANHIDFIVDGGFFLSTDAPGSPVMDAQMGDGGNIFGGEREVMLTTNSGFASVGTVNAPVGPGPIGPDPGSWLQFSNSITSMGLLTLTYDGAGATGLGGADFDTRWNSVVVDFAAVQGTGDVSIAFRDTNSNSGSLTQTVSSSGDFIFPFVDPAYSGVDFTSLDSVQLQIETKELASDFGINAVTREVVPEPSASGMALLAIVVFFLRRRSK